MTLPSTLQRKAQRGPATEERHYTMAEVAWLFGVDPKTVTRWCNRGYFQVVRTPGNHRRVTESEVRRVYEAGGGVWPA